MNRLGVSREPLEREVRHERVMPATFGDTSRIIWVHCIFRHYCRGFLE